MSSCALVPGTIRRPRQLRMTRVWNRCWRYRDRKLRLDVCTSACSDGEVTRGGEYAYSARGKQFSRSGAFAPRAFTMRVHRGRSAIPPEGTALARASLADACLLVVYWSTEFGSALAPLQESFLTGVTCSDLRGSAHIRVRACIPSAAPLASVAETWSFCLTETPR